MFTGNENERGFVETKITEAPKIYLDLEPEKGKEITYDLHVKRMNLAVSPAKRTLVVVYGGPRLGRNPEEELRETTRIVMDAGAEGRKIGRNFWGRPIKEAKKLTNLVAEVMKDQRYNRKSIETRFKS